jgi:DNA helicase HerA-like ATPase
VQNRIIFITGRKATGKTTFSNALAAQAYHAGRRVIVVAPMGGFDLPGCPTVHSQAEMLSDRTVGRSFVLNPPDDATALLAIRFAYALGNVLLVVDEIDLYADVRSPDPIVMQIIRYGRHRGVSLLGVSQRPANVVRDMTAQCDFIVMFQSTELRDVAYLSDRIGNDNAEKIRALPQFTYMTYSAFEGGLVTVSPSALIV